MSPAQQPRGHVDAGAPAEPAYKSGSGGPEAGSQCCTLGCYREITRQKESWSPGSEPIHPSQVRGIQSTPTHNSTGLVCTCWQGEQVAPHLREPAAPVWSACPAPTKEIFAFQEESHLTLRWRLAACPKAAPAASQPPSCRPKDCSWLRCADTVAPALAPAVSQSHQPAALVAAARAVLPTCTLRWPLQPRSPLTAMLEAATAALLPLWPPCWLQHPSPCQSPPMEAAMGQQCW